MREIAARSLPPVPATPWMRPLPPATRFVLHGDARARSAVAPVWGVQLVEEPCRALLAGNRATLWLGPDEYLLLEWDAAPDGHGAERIAGTLESALAGTAHALVDISQRQFALEISGPHAATLLSGACPLDLDLSEFPVGMCTRTVLAKADIVLWRTRADAFHLEVWRSFSDYVTGLLSEIAREIYG